METRQSGFYAFVGGDSDVFPIGYTAERSLGRQNGGGREVKRNGLVRWKAKHLNMKVTGRWIGKFVTRLSVRLLLFLVFVSRRLHGGEVSDVDQLSAMAAKSGHVQTITDTAIRIATRQNKEGTTNSLSRRCTAIQGRRRMQKMGHGFFVAIRKCCDDDRYLKKQSVASRKGATG